MIGDLPVSGKIAKLKLQVRKFFCENLDCCRKILPNDLKNNSFHVGGRLTEHPQLFYKKYPIFSKVVQAFFLIIGKPM